jgi:hypothetical protein
MHFEACCRIMRWQNDGAVALLRRMEASDKPRPMVRNSGPFGSPARPEPSI